MKMVPALLAVEGAGSTEVETHYLRRTSWSTASERPRYGSRYSGACGSSNIVAGSTRRPGKPVNAYSIGRTGGNSGQILEAHHALWALLSAMGNLEEAVLHMEHGIAVYDRACTRRRPRSTQVTIRAPAVATILRRTYGCWVIPIDQCALKDALRLAEELKHPMTSSITLWYAACVYYQRGDRSAMRASLERLLALDDGTRYSGAREFASVILEACALDSGKSWPNCTVDFRRHEDLTGIVCSACVPALRGDEAPIEHGLAVLASISAEDREAIYAPEIHRLEGELRRRLPSPDTEQIERCFHAALALARQRTEKSLELRAAMSIARLWRDQGRRAEAHELNTPSTTGSPKVSTSRTSRMPVS